MAICYNRLFHMMIDKKITNAQLKEMTVVSGNIITRLKRNEYISLESIEKICKTYGEKIIFEGKEYYTFPTPDELSKAEVVDLRKFVESVKNLIRYYNEKKVKL